MAGLDKIIDRILNEAGEEAAAIETKAASEVEGILAAANAEAGTIKSKAEKEAQTKADAYLATRANTDEQNRKIAILKTKSDLVDEVIAEAYDALCGLDIESYFELILKLLEPHVTAEEGCVCLSAKDLGRVPADFSAKVSALGSSKGGVLTVSQDTVDIEAGAVLVYGDIEENCSFKAVFNAERDNFRDKAQKILFS